MVCWEAPSGLDAPTETRYESLNQCLKYREFDPAIRILAVIAPFYASGDWSSELCGASYSVVMTSWSDSHVDLSTCRVVAAPGLRDAVAALSSQLRVELFCEHGCFWVERGACVKSV